MDDGEIARRVKELLAGEPAEFQRRVRADADRLTAAIEDGVFDNPQAIVGLECEFYAVFDPTQPGNDDVAGTAGTSLMRVPRRLLDFIRFEKELGLHNAELRTSPLPLNADGLRAQEAEVTAQLRTADDCVRSEGIRLVSDALWTIPPDGETAREYLTASTVENGVRIASNMSNSPRYHAMGNVDGDARPRMHLTAPNVSLPADTVMPESLITSIQPHYQVPQAAELPTYFRYALRIAGPLLALGVNSPLFPPDLYDDVPPERILSDAWMGHRIQVFESVLNAEHGRGKVRFPRDTGSISEIVDRIVEDDVLVPEAPTESGRFDDQFGAFRTKHGTYWRWIRPVFDGATRSAANARIEFRPIGAQPTVRDTVAFQAAFAGLLESLVREEHPVAELDWERAEANFYAAARDGLRAELEWIDGDGRVTTDREAVYEDLLDHAADGLRERDFSEETIGRYLGPLRRRVRYGLTPARWKIRRLREELEERSSFENAVYATQRRYVRRQMSTMFERDFGAWIEEYRYRAE